MVRCGRPRDRGGLRSSRADGGPQVLPPARATVPPWLPAKSVRVSNLPACCALGPPACAAPFGMAAPWQGLPVRLERAPHRGAAFALSNASKRARTRSIGSRSRGSLFIFRSSPAVAPPGRSSWSGWHAETLSGQRHNKSKRGMDRTPNLKFTKAGEVKLAARKVSNGNNFVEFDRSGHADFPHPALGQDITPSPTAPTRYKRAKANTV